MNKDTLKEFILKASRATYASGNESIKQKQSDESTTIVFEDGEYRYHDNYFGGEPYGGREVIFFNNKPVWMMVYYGLVHNNTEAKEVYPFLVQSLSNTTLDMLYRGPTLFEKENWKYTNDFKGDVENLSGIEKIFKDNVCVYEASYMGGFVAQ
ncbi:MAG: DUF5680 domain-containing protein [Candidatus Paceibacterota bacterium]|jgi:hypothetical protein